MTFAIMWILSFVLYFIFREKRDKSKNEKINDKSKNEKINDKSKNEKIKK